MNIQASVNSVISSAAVLKALGAEEEARRKQELTDLSDIVGRNVAQMQTDKRTHHLKFSEREMLNRNKKGLNDMISQGYFSAAEEHYIRSESEYGDRFKTAQMARHARESAMAMRISKAQQKTESFTPIESTIVMPIAEPRKTISNTQRKEADANQNNRTWNSNYPKDQEE